MKLAIKWIKLNLSRTWTDTYDVLKQFSYRKQINRRHSWTDTYDVLKHLNLRISAIRRNLEPTHMMYWNEVLIGLIGGGLALNRHIWCIETIIMSLNFYKIFYLNRHIWCIETRVFSLWPTLLYFLNRHIWCIETINHFCHICTVYILNRHIWCIETWKLKKKIKNINLEPTHMMYWNMREWRRALAMMSLNRHIWCIETSLTSKRNRKRLTWTDTYDVLKHERVKKSFSDDELEPTHMMYWNSGFQPLTDPPVLLNRHIWCIETSFFTYFDFSILFLNRHIWCIETFLLVKDILFLRSWTDTYDVLKHNNLYISSIPLNLEPTHMMYWNSGVVVVEKDIGILEPTHMMYWNREPFVC